MNLVFLKSNVKGYVRKDGVSVAPHSNKVIAQQPKSKGLFAHTVAKHAQAALFDHKAPLPDEAYAGLDKPVEKPAQAGLFGDAGPAPEKPKAKQPAGGLMANFGSNGAKSAASKSPKVIGAQYGGQTASAAGSSSGPWGGAKQSALYPAKVYPNAALHPQPHDNGKPFLINEPSTPSDPHTWADPALVATFIPGGRVPEALNGVPFSTWEAHPKSAEEWENVPGQMADLDEPELAADAKKEPAAGVIIEEPDGRIWIMNPSNGFGGYKATYPKGRADDGMSLQASAIKEAFEETGLQIEITGYVGDIERSQTIARYYRARRVGGTPKNMGWEAQAVQLVPPAKLHAILNMSVDRTIAKMAGFEEPGKAV